ncbi:MAG: efflux RND transporter periplasmic adaptor subunit [Granulosicoccus sp.]
MGSSTNFATPTVVAYDTAGYKFLKGTCYSVIAGCLLAGFMSTTDASLEVLSDMDCVIEPSALIELGSAVPGLISESYFDRSDFVNQGAVVARLESSVERVSLLIAEQAASSSTAIELRRLTASFGDRTRARNEKMLKTASVSRQIMDQVTTEAQIAELQLAQEREGKLLAELEVERAKASLNRREIRSPFSGTITERYKTTGEYVDNDPIYQVAQLDPLNVEVIVPIDYLGTVESGMTAQVTLDVPGFENKVLEAIVRRIDSVADAASATYGVRLTLDNPEMTIPSGVRCQVDFFAS